MEAIKTGVLIHGCNLHIENWRYVTWGDPPSEPGRIPHGIATALQFDAELIVMGTGASKEAFHFGDAPDDETPLLEAEYSLKYLDMFWDSLPGFDCFANVVQRLADPDAKQVRSSVMDRIVLDLESQNTVEEITNAARICRQRNIERLVLVSSPSHIVRALRDAAAIFATDDELRCYQCQLLASPSVTCYEGSTPADVVVVEPPHRPDRQVLPTHRRIQRMLDLQQMPGEDLVSLIEDFDQLLQRYEHRHSQRPPSTGGKP